MSLTDISPSTSDFSRYTAQMIKMLRIIFILLLLSGISLSVSAVAEPARCLELQPISDEPSDPVEWLIKNGEMLKKNGCWSTHVSLGERALKKTVIQKRQHEELQLSLQLASSYFYLGNYRRCHELADLAVNLAKSAELWQETIEGLYLKSAVARVNGKKQAVALSEEALDSAERHAADNPRLRAKILYNLGAALSDSDQPDLVRARTVLREASDIYRRIGSEDYEIVRTGLRLARVEYLRKNYRLALKEARAVKKYLQEPRAKMLYHYQIAKIEHRLKHWVTAREDALQGLALAQTLGAVKDRQRLEVLLEAVRKKEFLNE